MAVWVLASLGSGSLGCVVAPSKSLNTSSSLGLSVGFQILYLCQSWIYLSAYLFFTQTSKCVTKRENMRGSTFQVSSLAPSEEEVFKLLLSMKTSDERLILEFQFMFDQRNICIVQEQSIGLRISRILFKITISRSLNYGL